MWRCLSLEEVYRCFRRSCCLHNGGRWRQRHPPKLLYASIRSNGSNMQENRNLNHFLWVVTMENYLMTFFNKQARKWPKYQISGGFKPYLFMQLYLHVLDQRRVAVPSVLPPQLDPAAANERATCILAPQRLLPAGRENGRRNLGWVVIRGHFTQKQPIKFQLLMKTPNISRHLPAWQENYPFKVHWHP